VNREALGKVVFADPQARLALEGLVHPAIREFVLDRLDAWRREGWQGLAVIDAALLVEASSPYPLDALVVVTASEEVRLDRLEAKGVSREEARERMRAQASDEEKRRRADWVLTNDGTPDDLEREVDALLVKLGRDGGP
jgi:dephospho-CoA kinase